MSSIKSLLKNKVIVAGSWYTITNFFVRGLSFLTIPIFTRILNTDDYGTVSLYSTWVSIFSILLSLSLVESIRRAKYDFENMYDQFVSSVVFLSLMIFLFQITIVMIFNTFFQNITGLSFLLLFLALINSFFSYIIELGITKLRMEYKYKPVSILSIILALLQIALSIYLTINIFKSQKYLGKIIGNSSLVIVFGMGMLVYFLIKGKKLIQPQYWKYSLLLSIPLIPHSLSGILNAQFDRIIINRYIGETATGVYSFAYSIGLIIEIIYLSMDQAWLPWFFEKMKSRDYESIRKIANNYISVFCIIYMVILMLSPELVKIMAPQSFWEGLSIIPWIFLAYFFRVLYGFEVSVEYSEKKTGLISIVTIISALINIVLNVIFIPKYGYYAAAVTTTVSYMFLFIFHYYSTTKILNIKLYGLKFHFKYLSYSIITTILFWLFVDLFLVRILLILIVISSLLIYYKMIYGKKKKRKKGI